MEQKVYDILTKQVNNTTEYKDRTKKDYIRFLKKIKDFNGEIMEIDKLTKFIKDNYTISSAIKVLNLIVNYFRITENKEMMEKYYNLRDEFNKEYTSRDKKEIFNGKTKKDYIKLLKGMENSKYKLIFLLMIKYNSLRLGDYHTLKIGDDGENYISGDFGKVVFNKIIKVKIIKPIEFKLEKVDVKLFKKVIGDEKGMLFHENLSAYKKQMERISKSVFGLNPKDFRNLSYLGISNGVKKVKEISRKQGHSVGIAIDYYV